MRRIGIFLFLGFIFSACQSKEPWEIEVEEKISQLNRDTEVTEINLDFMDQEVAEPNTILRVDTTDGVTIGLPSDMIVLKDSLYLLDQAQNSILVLDEEGIITRKIDKEGRGPGEVTRPTGMTSNGNFVFVYDHGNSRLHMFDLNFNIFGSVSAFPDGFSRSVTAADSLINIYDAQSFRSGEEKLIKQYLLYPELKKERNLVPRLLPLGIQPAVINKVSFSANSGGNLVVGYDSLPRLFLFSPNGDLIHSLRFSGSPVDKVYELNEKNKQKHRLNPGSTLGLAPFHYSVLLDDQFNIYMFIVGHKLIVLSLKNNRYELSGSYILEHPDGGGIRENLVISENSLFLHYENYPNDILVYNLKKLLHQNP